MILFHVGLKLGGDFVISLLRRELASRGETLAAIGAAPGNGVPVDLFCNN
jgi:hypothetical protein